MLHIAFYNQSHFVVTTIMNSASFNADTFDCTDSNGLTHLHIACAYGNDVFVEKLLKTGSDVNAVCKYDIEGESSNFTPLHFAVLKQHSPTVQNLLMYGANVNLKDSKGRTPLHILCYSNNKSADSQIIWDLIICNNKSMNVKDNQGNTPMLSLLSEKYEENPFGYIFNSAELEFHFNLLVIGSDFTVTNNEGNTVLHLLIKNLRFFRKPKKDSVAMSFDDTNFVQLITKILDSCRVKSKINRIVNLKNKLGETPLQLAVFFMSFDIVKLLLNRGARLKGFKLDCFFYPNLVPVFEPVQNLICIIELLIEKKYTFNPQDNLKILKFLIHEANDCDCPVKNSLLGDLSMKFNIVLNFGSPSHIIAVLEKQLVDNNIGMFGSSTKEKLAPVVWIYLDIVNAGNFYINTEVKQVLQQLVQEPLNVNFQNEVREFRRRQFEYLNSATSKNGVKLFDLLQKNPHKITRQVKNSDVNAAIANAHPTCQNIIQGHITKALIRSYFEDSTYELIKNKLFYTLPDLCFEMIMSFLRNSDIFYAYIAVIEPFDI